MAEQSRALRRSIKLTDQSTYLDVSRILYSARFILKSGVDDQVSTYVSKVNRTVKLIMILSAIPILSSFFLFINVLVFERENIAQKTMSTSLKQVHEKERPNTTVVCNLGSGMLEVVNSRSQHLQRKMRGKESSFCSWRGYWDV